MRTSRSWLLTMVLTAPAFLLAPVLLHDPVNYIVTGVIVTYMGGWI